jgi:hypothetical protein
MLNMKTMLLSMTRAAACGAVWNDVDQLMNLQDTQYRTKLILTGISMIRIVIRIGLKLTVVHRWVVRISREFTFDRSVRLRCSQYFCVFSPSRLLTCSAASSSVRPDVRLAANLASIDSMTPPYASEANMLKLLVLNR